MANSPEWVLLEQGNAIEEVKKAPNGETTVHMVVSQYDRPREARAYYDAVRKLVQIEFRYLSPEATRHLHVSDRVTAEIGRTSQRIYALSINATLAGTEQIKVDIDAAMTRLNSTMAHGRGDKPPLNYAMARQVIADQFSRLFKDVGLPELASVAK